MTYGEGLFLPMVKLVQYLAEHDFKVFISSGSERALVRELIEGTLGEWVPSERVIGSSFSLMASGQGDKAGRSHTCQIEDEVPLEGQVFRALRALATYTQPAADYSWGNFPDTPRENAA